LREKHLQRVGRAIKAAVKTDRLQFNTSSFEAVANAKTAAEWDRNWWYS
jgi:hypothetical protein